MQQQTKIWADHKNCLNDIEIKEQSAIKQIEWIMKFVN